jgi:hypothetical protein
MISRRQFLSIAGVSLLGLAPKSPFAAAFNFPIQHGRTLDTLLVRKSPSLQADVTKWLWADSVLDLLEIKGDWLRIADGYVARESVQPMLPYTPQAAFTRADAPFWAEVAAPVAAIHAWCAADAPLMARIGHGGVMRMVDALPDAWYAVESDKGTRLGWTQAVFWQAVADDNPDVANARLEISVARQTLQVFDDQQQIMSAPISTGQALQSGEYTINQRQMGGTSYDIANEVFQGVPYRLAFGGYELLGAYWHNQFGRTYAGPAVQMSPIAARWLYRQMREGSSVVIRA